MEKKNIVIIGGGSRSAWLLNGLVRHKDKYNLAVVGSIADNGGSNGRLQESLGVTGLGALRKCLLALSEADEDVKNSFTYRFDKGELAGHVVGNILMAALEKVSGSAESALSNMHKILKVDGYVIPASFDKVTLCAELENGEIVEGETNIDFPKHDGKLKINKIFLKPIPKINSSAIEEVANADLVIIGPGDLFTTILPNFLVPGIAESVRKSKAKKIFIVNPWNKFGETTNFTVLDFVNEAEKYLGDSMDSVIYNFGNVSKEGLARFRKKHPEALDLVKIIKGLDSKKFIGEDMLDEQNLGLDLEKLVKVIMSL